VKIIVDTNIFISALLNPKGTELELLMNPWAKGIFYSCDFLRKETLRIKEKIIRLSGLSETDLLNLIIKVSGKINFLNEEQIPEMTWKEAYNYTKDVDESDTAFMALTLYLRGIL
jgi:predicted nucleic acid-binding protein